MINYILFGKSIKMIDPNNDEVKIRPNSVTLHCPNCSRIMIINGIDDFSTTKTCQCGAQITINLTFTIPRK